MVPRMSVRKSFRCFFREDFSMTMVPFWDYLLPSTLSFIGCVLSQLQSYCCFGDPCLKPNFVALFPSRNCTYPDRCAISQSSPFKNRSPVISFGYRDCGRAIYSSIVPVNFWVGGFKKGITQNEIVLTNVSDIKSVKCLFSIVVNCKINSF